MRLVVDVPGESVWLESGDHAFPVRGHVDFPVRVVLEFVTATRALQYARVGERQRPIFYDTSAVLLLEKSAPAEIRALTPAWSASMPFAEWQSHVHATARTLLADFTTRGRTSPDLALLAAHVPGS